MLLRLFLLFTIVPALELYILVKVGGLIGPLQTVAMVVALGMLGASLAKRAGLGMLRQLNEDLAQGIPPADRVVEALLILVGGVLLVTPGLLTDAVGLLLLVPPLRRALVPLIKSWLVKRFLGKGGFFYSSQGFSFRVGAPEPGSGPVSGEASEEPHRPRFDHPVA